jgi:glycosyltransferase involved in cell wall biosynthesis
VAGHPREAVDIRIDNPPIEVSVVMPCLNEERTLTACITKAQAALLKLGVSGEVVVADNGSTDRSVEIAEALGARVVHQPDRGYGSAYQAGLAAARGRFIIIADSDNTYDFGELPRFVEVLQEGRCDLVIGSRLRGSIQPGAMPFLHRYVGTPILTALINVMFGIRISDSQSGMRGLTREAYGRLNLRTTGMEFASEMIVRAAQLHLRIADIPISYYPREGDSKLRTLQDGWRHLRFLLLHSPTFLFLVPGGTLLGVGLGLMLLVGFGRVHFPGGVVIDIHTMIAGSLAAILGFQVVCLGLYAKAYAGQSGLAGSDAVVQRLVHYLALERGLTVGLLIILLGLGSLGFVVHQWVTRGLVLDRNLQLRPALWGLTLTVLGTQVVFASFLLGVLRIRYR